MSIPETLRVWRNGRVVYSTPVNTGIASRPMAAGTFPVYARYLSTTMRGTNPDGTKYNDPGVPYVAYFNGGDAVHGFVRGSYGWPQSLGCVELPYSAAAVVFGYDPIGTLGGCTHAVGVRGAGDACGPGARRAGDPWRPRRRVPARSLLKRSPWRWPWRIGHR